jgi:hypothetical protein
MAFASVEVYLKPFSHPSLGGKDLLQEGIDRCVVVLFIYHVESNYKLVARGFVLLIDSMLNCIKHGLDVPISEEF